MSFDEMASYKLEGRRCLSTAFVFQGYVLPTYQEKFPGMKRTEHKNNALVLTRTFMSTLRYNFAA
jgi:hypothetical protein